MNYEAYRSEPSDYLILDQHHNLSFADHMHASMEMFYVKSGTTRCTIGGREYEIRAGEAALILPYESHSYHDPCGSEGFLLIASMDFVPEFAAEARTAELCSPIFRPTPSLFEIDPEKDSRFINIGKLYLLCGEAVAQNGMRPRSSKNILLIQRIIEYIDHHFMDSIALIDVAKELGYSYNYLSCFINKSLGCSFSDILNDCRISRAIVYLRNADKSVAEVSEMCGFGSIRSFNRSFKKTMGLTPKEFLKTGTEE